MSGYAFAMSWLLVLSTRIAGLAFWRIEQSSVGVGAGWEDAARSDSQVEREIG